MVQPCSSLSWWAGLLLQQAMLRLAWSAGTLLACAFLKVACTMQEKAVH